MPMVGVGLKPAPTLATMNVIVSLIINNVQYHAESVLNGLVITGKKTKTT
jgi:hypothetical protein